MPKLARLRLQGHGGVEIQLVTAYLTDLKRAYDSVVVFEQVIDGIEKLAQEFPFRIFPIALSAGWPVGSRRYTQLLRDWPPTGDQLASLVPASEEIIISAVQLTSPGFWDFLGALNPLEVLRRYLNDRHERKKDGKYRETAEERRLRLENLILENQMIAGRIKIAKSLGATNRDLAPLINVLVRSPLMALDQHQDRAVIENAEFVKPTEKD